MGKGIDLTGQKINSLTVLKRKRENNRTYYYCRCDCKNELWVRADCLTSGNTKSCGCLGKETQFKPIDIKNKKFNRLTAIEPTKKRAENDSIIWKCRCDCGKIKYVSAGDLTSGKIKSCGCLIPEVSKENVKKATEVHLRENIVEGTNIPAISRKEVIASNTSGATGVRWDKSRQKWIAEIRFKKKWYFLGRYEKKEDAVKIRKTAEDKLFGPFLKQHNQFFINMASDCIRVFEMVLSGEEIKFPKWYWQDISNMQLRGLLIYFFEEKLQWKQKDVREKLNKDIFKKYKLSGMTSTIFKGNIYKTIDLAYLGKFKKKHK